MALEVGQRPVEFSVRNSFVCEEQAFIAFRARGRTPIQVNIVAYPREFEFDANQLDRLKHLFQLKGICLAYQHGLEHAQQFEGTSEGTGYTSFFLAMSDEVDALIYNFINDEATTCLAGRGPTKAIIDQLATDAQVRGEDLIWFRAVKDFRQRTENYRDHYIGRCYLDFTVSTYSIFETWMSRLYIALRETEEERRSSRRRDIAKLISKLAIAQDDAERDQIIDKIGKHGGGQTGSGEIGYVFKRALNYQVRNKEFDREYVKSYAAMRNTVHNMGVNRANVPFVLKGPDFEIVLPAGKARQVADYSDGVKACMELVHIYAALICSLDVAHQPCVVTIVPPTGAD